jgi:hypothetical protein
MSVIPEFFQFEGRPEIFRRVLIDDGVWILRAASDPEWKAANIELTDELGRTPLMLAAWFGKRIALNALIQSGAKLEARDREGKSGYDYAQWTGEGLHQQEDFLTDRAARLSAETFEAIKEPGSKKD